ncbi:hypothetical protein CEE37_10710 [candidate division LCP-89 bacterium B3_LCP]|uniref:histidine kinase n=1 Tax=candidate division LCP-89 bacterium B3_LCP TaxID=2012998 RepID=A0A532UXR4_UNCL8|nr:MAG: hypothetical protein CEE37_10710 [candidate division LCP-89 bacterium B3_LCP]
MKTIIDDSIDSSIDTITPEIIKLYSLLAPYVSTGRQINGITHNLNSPLTGLMGSVELMAMKYPEFSSDLDVILELSKTLRDSIAALQNKYEIETNHTRTAININYTLKNNLAHLRADLFFKHFVECTPEFGKDIPNLSGSYADFALTFEEILLNAIDAQREQNEGWVGVRTYRQDSSIFVEISDKGPGFTDEALRNAFQPFWPEIKEIDEGRVHLGMGLFMCKQWLKPYGGDIELNNPEEGGALVRVRIPADQ